MNNDTLKNLLVDESLVLNQTEAKHIANYKNLISFFEAAITESALETETNYQKLLLSCIKCIRHLDQIVVSYDSQLNAVREKNKLIEYLIDQNNLEFDKKKLEKDSVGKDQEETS